MSPQMIVEDTAQCHSQGHLCVHRLYPSMQLLVFAYLAVDLPLLVIHIFSLISRSCEVAIKTRELQWKKY